MHYAARNEVLGINIIISKSQFCFAANLIDVVVVSKTGVLPSTQMGDQYTVASYSRIILNSRPA